ncbi:Chitinase-3-like protein 1, partial [Bienertia sinuspersici]
GQGELYSPNHAIKINNDDNTNNNNTPNHLKEKIHHHHHHHQNQELSKGNNMVGKGVANDIKNKMHMIKERLMEKLTAASVPSDALENARHYVESVIKDVTSAAQGITMEALLRIKSHLADILPSLSPSLTSKVNFIPLLRIILFSLFF